MDAKISIDLFRSGITSYLLEVRFTLTLAHLLELQHRLLYLVHRRPLPSIGLTRLGRRIGPRRAVIWSSALLLIHEVLLLQWLSSRRHLLLLPRRRRCRH